MSVCVSFHLEAQVVLFLFYNQEAREKKKNHNKCVNVCVLVVNMLRLVPTNRGVVSSATTTTKTRIQVKHTQVCAPTPHRPSCGTIIIVATRQDSRF